VHIVIGYRPLFDFWRSAYYQDYSHYCGYSHEDTRTIPSLLDFLDTVNETKQLRHPSYGALHHFQQYFTDIIVLPLGDKFTERFLCTAVIRASRACAAVKRQDNETTANHGHSLAFDRLAQEARLQGLSQLSCKKLSNSIQVQLKKQNSSVLDLPRTCLDESQLEWLWNKSLFYQHALVPNGTDVQLERTSICQVNVDEVLTDYRYLFAANNSTRTP
jgi:hypothetical protein